MDETRNPILERIERVSGIPGLISVLADRLEPSDLQSLLLEVYRRIAAKRSPAQVLAAYGRDPAVRPARVNAARLMAWERTVLEHLPPEVRMLELSPICPLGTNSAVAQVDQNRALSTARNTEVVSDSTNVLALECAWRRREHLRNDPRSRETVHLASRHRLLRPQRYADPNLVPHFGLFALCSAGRAEAGINFELAAITMHARFYLAACRAHVGSNVPLRFSVTSLGPVDRRSALEESVLGPMRDAFAGVTCDFEEDRQTGRGYYLEFCFHIHARDASGAWVQLADGGVVDWTQKLLGNAKERLFISGIGSERVAAGF